MFEAPGAAGGENDITRVAGLVFLTPEPGVYRARGNASVKPWTGEAKTFRLGIFKKDTQRSAQEQTINLPRDGTPVPFDITVELAAGHELVFLPVMKGMHNNAANLTVADLRIERVPERSKK